MTKIKILCFFVTVLFCTDAFSQLKVLSGSGGIIGTCNGHMPNNPFTYCTKFTLPINNLTFDESNPDDYPCYPVDNFGCDLHIGLTINGVTSYVRITSCIAEQIDEANNAESLSFPYQDEPGNYPLICNTFPLNSNPDPRSICPSGLYQASLKLYCMDENGDYTTISALASQDPNGLDNWSTLFGGLPEVFPDGSQQPTLVVSETWDMYLCCDEKAYDEEPPKQGEYIPRIGQNNDGSVVFFNSFNELKKTDISIFDANNQMVEYNGDLYNGSELQYSMDLSNLNPGFYYIRAKSDLTIYSTTIIRL